MNHSLRNIEEVVESVQMITNMLVDASSDLEALNNEVEVLTELTGEVEIVRQVAVILRSLHPLLEKLSPVSTASQACSSSPEKTEAYLRSLALTLDELSYDPQLSTGPEINNKLHRSAKIVSTVSAFTSRLRTLSVEFGSSCFTDKKSIVLTLEAMGRMIESLGDMFSTLGNSKAAQEVRERTVITDRIMVSSHSYPS